MNKNTFIAALALAFYTTFPASAHAVAVSGQGTWETTLKARDLDGDASTIEAYYDTVLGITWLADANYAGSAMDWYTATNWAATLDISGITGWRLPETNPVNGVNYDYGFMGGPGSDGTSDGGFNISAPGTLYSGSTGSEMAHMFYNTLGNLGTVDIYGAMNACISAPPGHCLTNTGPFSNLKSKIYLSATEFELDPVSVWFFDMSGGGQFTFDKYNANFVWVVHSGDVGTAVVPLPAAAWLFGSGLLGLIGVARKKAHLL